MLAAAMASERAELAAINAASVVALLPAAMALLSTLTWLGVRWVWSMACAAATLASRCA